MIKLIINKRDRFQFEMEMFQIDLMTEIQKLMEKQNISYRELAKKMKISKKKLHKLYSADKRIKIKNIVQLQRIFNIRYNIKEKK